ncbi:uncharacterized protein PHACADRAFT_31839 [Phanerochaete carnosa HHB-10118-sp]|uniref:Uncharacterized protein n=1 Tax=Phanerochaete carnosa (strain HHB-10118-sp) TaxID=650164 RepID=K5VYZ9_PHACS|nr:uncharacterized protein PHACADRAFT_31839 [Phanerochaete carnosa HHB-10118-sp]EKM52070.1 hypothetical protein PHACADRAFT_31839 [Phanerochaete carnosa HHB-10118-sp]
MLHMLNQEQQLLQISSARPILEEWWNFTCSVVTPECFIPSGGQEGLIILLDFSELMDRREDAVRLFQTFWRFQDRSFMTLCRGFAALHPRSRASTISAAQIITDSFISGRLDGTFSSSLGAYYHCSSPSISSDQATMITHSIRLMKVYAAGHLNGSGFTVLDVVRFTLFHLRLYDIHLGREVHWQPCYSPHPRRTNSPSPLADTIDWAGLWHVLVRALKEYKRAERWKKPYSSDQEYWHATTQPILTADELLAQDRELATECLRITESIEEADSGDECHLAVDRSTPHFEDEFVVALGCFILPEDVPKFPSLVKLEVKGRFSPELQKERDQGNDKEESESEKEDSDDDRKSSGRGRLRRIVTKTRRNGIEIRLPVNLGSS